MFSNISKCSNFDEFLSSDYDFLSSDFSNATLTKHCDHSYNERCQAKDDQDLHLPDLSKNVLFVVFEYLDSPDIFAVVKCNKRLHNKLTVDPYFHTIAAQALCKFFLQQFVQPMEDLSPRFNSFAS